PEDASLLRGQFDARWAAARPGHRSSPYTELAVVLVRGGSACAPRRGDVDRGDPEREPLGADLFEPGRADHPRQTLGGREGTERTRQVAIRIRIAAERRGDAWRERAEIPAVDRIEERLRRMRELEEDGAPVRPQNATDLAQRAGQVADVPQQEPT